MICELLFPQKVFFFLLFFISFFFIWSHKVNSVPYFMQATLLFSTARLKRMTNYHYFKNCIVIGSCMGWSEICFEKIIVRNSRIWVSYWANIFRNNVCAPTPPPPRPVILRGAFILFWWHCYWAISRKDCDSPVPNSVLQMNRSSCHLLKTSRSQKVQFISAQ